MVDFITWLIAIKKVALQFSNTFKRNRSNYRSEVKNQLIRNGLNVVICGFAKILLTNPFKMGNKVRKIFKSSYSQRCFDLGERLEN